MCRFFSLLTLLIFIVFCNCTAVFSKQPYGTSSSSGGQSSTFEKESKEIKLGIVRHTIRTVSDKGPVIAHVLEIDLNNEKISVKVGLPNKVEIKSKEYLTNIVKNEMAFAGINANYFDVKVGNPLGTLITEGEWLIGPIYDRVAIGFTSNKKTLIDKVMLSGTATVYRGFRKKPFAMFDIDALNIPIHLYKKVGLFTLNWDEKLELPNNRVAISVVDGCVKQIRSGVVNIPRNGYILVSNDDFVLNFLKRKDCIDVEWSSMPEWSSVQDAVSGGPYLVMNGQVYIDEKEQNFKFANKDTYAPRSAVGIGKDGKLYLVAIDGKKENHSTGFTLKQLAKFLKTIGLKDAINLDGGGSTTLVLDGKIINKLSDHHERKISNGLLIFYND